MRLALELPPWQIKQILKYSSQGVFLHLKKQPVIQKIKEFQLRSGRRNSKLLPF